KDNTGYDLKHLFIGAEGTLGVITAAVLKLAPRPGQVEAVFAAVRGPDGALELLARLRAASGDQVEAFELMPRLGIDFALAHVAGTVDPLAQRYPWYVLADLTAGRRTEAFRATIEETLAEAMDGGLIQDACLAESQEQARRLWHLREALVEAQRFEGGSIKHDVSVPVSSVPEFIRLACETVSCAIVGVRPLPFGHVGDGNIHFNLTQPAGADTAAFLARWDEINRLVHDIALGLGGSISAEHGIGRAKRGELARVKSPVEMDLMRRVKRALDPLGLMNPGKLLG
ncbi:MAG TPA: FAD-binding oxidoreductase, partial [Azospirillaceae bacterium]|nr:FAD-binding oxidoreductase [Azospirillaceae bacterium]